MGSSPGSLALKRFEEPGDVGCHSGRIVCKSGASAKKQGKAGGGGEL